MIAWNDMQLVHFCKSRSIRKFCKFVENFGCPPFLLGKIQFLDFVYLEMGFKENVVKWQVYHSSFVDEEGITNACGCPLVPLKSHIKGPAPVSDQGEFHVLIASLETLILRALQISSLYI
ncbi:uncharacterized protein LOC111286737 isoform X2 [Durio zibethinus]|uniref:Uncharacterized protein LOC111286737 isoform X2 n=1 Tax=Durio zibethinus TaxID=66656 RepID=A0A6P5XWQ5_DURZI|nr:uncharacterized protein LOC111286737 isoform X2 [Durio zibethinus]